MQRRRRRPTSEADVCDIVWSDPLVHFVEALRLANRALLRAPAHAAGATRLSPGQCVALSVIAQNPGLLQGELSALLGLDRPRVAGIVRRLGALGLVERRGASGTRKGSGLTLTRSGHETSRQWGEIVERALHRALAITSPADRTAASRVLHALTTAFRAPREPRDVERA